MAGPGLVEPGRVNKRAATTRMQHVEIDISSRAPEHLHPETAEGIRANLRDAAAGIAHRIPDGEPHPIIADEIRRERGRALRGALRCGAGAEWRAIDRPRAGDRVEARIGSRACQDDRRVGVGDDRSRAEGGWPCAGQSALLILALPCDRNEERLARPGYPESRPLPGPCLRLQAHRRRGGRLQRPRPAHRACRRRDSRRFRQRSCRWWSHWRASPRRSRGWSR